MTGMPPLLLRQAPTPGPAAPQIPAPTPGVIAPPGITASPTDFPIPRTAREVEVLKAIRDQISSQIDNVRSRRTSIARQYESASGANRAGLEQQLRILDQRIAQLELDLDASGRALYRATSATTAPPAGFQANFGNLNSGQITGISIVFIIFVLFPLAISASKALWRRAARPVMPAGWNDATARLGRLEQAVDTIAVEIERVSEGQRFITKIMTKGEPSATAGEPSAAAGHAPPVNGAQPLPALGPGSPEPIVFQNQRDEVRVRRG